MARPPVCFCSAMDTCLQERALFIVRDSLISLSLTVYYIRNPVFLFFSDLQSVGPDHFLLATGDLPAIQSGTPCSDSEGHWMRDMTSRIEYGTLMFILSGLARFRFTEQSKLLYNFYLHLTQVVSFAGTLSN